MLRRDNIRKVALSFVGMQVCCCFSVVSLTGYVVGLQLCPNASFPRDK